MWPSAITKVKNSSDDDVYDWVKSMNAAQHQYSTGDLKCWCGVFEFDKRYQWIQWVPWIENDVCILYQVLYLKCKYHVTEN